jgi:hypothetical protein
MRLSRRTKSFSAWRPNTNGEEWMATVERCPDGLITSIVAALPVAVAVSSGN